MRLRIDPLTANHIERVAREENRSRAEATKVLVAEAVRVRCGRPSQAPVAVEIDDAGVRGTTLACHCGGAILRGVQRFAEMDDRSLSAALRILLKDGLVLRGLIPAAKTPSR
jgi:hypothetical protein